MAVICSTIATGAHRPYKHLLHHGVKGESPMGKIEQEEEEEGSLATKSPVLTPPLDVDTHL